MQNCSNCRLPATDSMDLWSPCGSRSSLPFVPLFRPLVPRAVVSESVCHGISANWRISLFSRVICASNRHTGPPRDIPKGRVGSPNRKEYQYGSFNDDQRPVSRTDEAPAYCGAKGIARTQSAAAEFAAARGLLRRIAGQFDDHRPLARRKAPICLLGAERGTTPIKSDPARCGSRNGTAIRSAFPAGIRRGRAHQRLRVRND